MKKRKKGSGGKRLKAGRKKVENKKVYITF